LKAASYLVDRVRYLGLFTAMSNEVYESFKQMKAECDGRLGKMASKEMHWGGIHAVVKFGSSENAAPNATQQYR
jgi:hypothetical protein